MARDFDWLAEHREGLGLAARSGFTINPANAKTLLRLRGRDVLQVQNYAGVLQTPFGLTIEILPKIYATDDAQRSRQTLLRMLELIHGLPLRAAFDHSPLGTVSGDLSQWLVLRFLKLTAEAARRGLRREYHAISTKSSTVRGQIDFRRQARDPQGGLGALHLQYEELRENNPENRIIHSALLRAKRLAGSSLRAARLLRELLFCFRDIPPSRDFPGDFRLWRANRANPEYAQLRRWCGLLLDGQRPAFLRGSAPGISLLFPLDRLFEDYTRYWIKRKLSPRIALRGPGHSRKLARLQGGSRELFTLKPDLSLWRDGDCAAILDVKWKAIDPELRTHGIKSPDAYQLFAYGHAFLRERGDLVLIYPATEKFHATIGPYDLVNERRLWIVPFDLHADAIRFPRELREAFLSSRL